MQLRFCEEGVAKVKSQPHQQLSHRDVNDEVSNVQMCTHAFARLRHTHMLAVVIHIPHHN